MRTKELKKQIEELQKEVKKQGNQLRYLQIASAENKLEATIKEEAVSTGVPFAPKRIVKVQIDFMTDGGLLSQFFDAVEVKDIYYNSLEHELNKDWLEVYMNQYEKGEKKKKLFCVYRINRESGDVTRVDRDIYERYIKAKK